MLRQCQIHPLHCEEDLKMCRHFGGKLIRNPVNNVLFSDVRQRELVACRLLTYSDLISPLNDRRQKSATRDGLVIPRARLCT